MLSRHPSASLSLVLSFADVGCHDDPSGSASVLDDRFARCVLAALVLAGSSVGSSHQHALLSAEGGSGLAVRKPDQFPSRCGTPCRSRRG